MDNFKITKRNVNNALTISNDVDLVIIDDSLIIGVSPYGDKSTCTLIDSQGDEIELDAADLRATIEAFIELNNIK